MKLSVYKNWNFFRDSNYPALFSGVSTFAGLVLISCAIYYLTTMSLWGLLSLFFINLAISFTIYAVSSFCLPMVILTLYQSDGEPSKADNALNGSQFTPSGEAHVHFDGRIVILTITDLPRQYRLQFERRAEYDICIAQNKKIFKETVNLFDTKTKSVSMNLA